MGDRVIFLAGKGNFNDLGIADAGELEDRNRLASALRGVAYTTSAANIRNWCITTVSYTHLTLPTI